MYTASGLKVEWLSLAVFLSAKLAQLGVETLLNRCTAIISSPGCTARLLFGHQRNRRALQSLGTTFAWWNIASTSAMKATASCQKRVSTPTREFVRSGPCKSFLFKELPRYLAEQSNKMWTFPGLARWNTAWWGRYQVFPGTQVGGAFFAYPFWRMSSIQAVYFTRISGSLNRCFFNSLSPCSARLLLFSRQGGSSFHGNTIV